MTNRKSLTPFRLLPTSTTLDDLERPIRILFQKRCVFRSSQQKIEWRYTHTISGKNVGHWSRFWRHKVCADIRRDSLERSVKRQWGNRKRRFSGLLDALRHIRKWGQHYYTVLFRPLSPFQCPQNIWPWMTLTGYLALNSVFAPVWLTDTAWIRKIIAWKRIKIDTYWQRCKSSAGTLVSGDIRFVWIFGRVL